MYADVSLWQEAFPQLTWDEYLGLPAEVVTRTITYLKTRAEVEKAKRDINGR